MKRDYTDGVQDSATFFTGIEIEKTPAYGLKTLFVVGVQSISKIYDTAMDHQVQHIYLGANHSFNPQENDWIHWTNMIANLVGEYLITLDYDVKYHQKVIDMNWNSNENFISQISVKLPDIDKLNVNACLKIDDSGFKATNSGVWVHKLIDLQDTDVHTNWNQYGDDEIING